MTVPWGKVLIDSQRRPILCSWGVHRMGCCGTADICVFDQIRIVDRSDWLIDDEACNFWSTGPGEPPDLPERQESCYFLPSGDCCWHSTEVCSDVGYCRAETRVQLWNSISVDFGEPRTPAVEIYLRTSGCSPPPRYTPNRHAYISTRDDGVGASPDRWALSPAQWSSLLSGNNVTITGMRRLTQSFHNYHCELQDQNGWVTIRAENA